MRIYLIKCLDHVVLPTPVGDIDAAKKAAREHKRACPDHGYPLLLFVEADGAVPSLEWEATDANP